ncbi:hypothetical protein JB92DRAFT_3141031, partial [Gautieria morchelliformis]
MLFLCSQATSLSGLRLPSLLLDHRFPLKPSSRPPSLTVPMKCHGDLATDLKVVHARLNPSPQPLQQTLSPAPSTTSSSPAISSIAPPSYPASPAPTIADSADENITWDGKVLSYV